MPDTITPVYTTAATPATIAPLKDHSSFSDEIDVLFGEFELGILEDSDDARKRVFAKLYADIVRLRVTVKTRFDYRRVEDLCAQVTKEAFKVGRLIPIPERY